MTNVINFPGMKTGDFRQNRKSEQAIDFNAARLQGLANLSAHNNAVLEHRQCMRQPIETMPCRPMKT